MYTYVKMGQWKELTNEMEAEKIITYIVGIGNRLIRLKGACEKRNCLNNV